MTGDLDVYARQLLIGTGLDVERARLVAAGRLEDESVAGRALRDGWLADERADAADPPESSALR